jgi:hypothetical protein
MKLLRLIKMCSNETYRKVQTGTYTIQNGLKQEDALLPLLFNISLEYAIGSSKTRMDNGMHWLIRLIYSAKTQ